MVKVYDELLKTLDNLLEEEFEYFKHHLTQLTEEHDGFSPIPIGKVQMAKRPQLVAMISEKYKKHAVKVTVVILRKIDKYNLAEELSRIFTEQGTTTDPDPQMIPHPLDGTNDSEDGDIPQPEPPEDISKYQRILQDNLKGTLKPAKGGPVERMDQQCLSEIFTDLYITPGSEVHINDQHEVVEMGMSKVWEADTDKRIEPKDIFIFRSPSGEVKPVRLLMTTGIAGIGKTILVHKFVLDWAERKSNQDVHLIFSFTFRELNLYKDEKFVLADLIHKLIWDTKDISTEKLNNIFEFLQASGNRDFNESKYKILFVFDGLDESRLQLGLDQKENPVHNVDLHQSRPLALLLKALIKGDLLPSARIWITSRPGSTSKIYKGLIDSMSVVRGFTDLQRVEYFRKSFSDGQEADKVLNHIKSSRTLFIMCHIPVFCAITTIVLKGVLKAKTTNGELPATLTEMYTEYLLYQINQMRKTYSERKSLYYIRMLAKLAFNQLHENQPIFYEEDLKKVGRNFRDAVLHFEGFTEVFKEVRPWRTEDKKGKMFNFVHLTLQEYLSALHVVISLINKNRDLLSETQIKLESLCTLCRRKSVTQVHQTAIDQSLQYTDRHLDLFLRFLLGLSLKTNQDLLKCLLQEKKGFTKSEHDKHRIDAIELIKKRIRESDSPERCINLFYCLNELKDGSLEEEIQQYLSSGRLSTDKLSPALWSTLVFVLLSSQEALEVFDLKKYSASEEGLLKLLPVVKASQVSLLNNCYLTERSCEFLASVLCSQSSKLRELDLSDNDLQDSGVNLLCEGLKSPDCGLKTLRLSGCMITTDGCKSLAEALKVNPPHLEELDLSFNHPGDIGKMMLTSGMKKGWKLKTLNFNDCGEQRLKPGVKKYICDLSLDENTAHRKLKLTDNRRKVEVSKYQQLCPHHPARFDYWLQVLCNTGLTGRGYWEVEYTGKVYIAVTYNGIRRIGEGSDGCLGRSNQSWMLLCDDGGRYTARHNDQNREILPQMSPLSNRVAVFLDVPAGVLTFYNVVFGTLEHLFTFNTEFTEPLYPAFGFGFDFAVSGNRNSYNRSSVSFCEVEGGNFSSRC